MFSRRFWIVLCTEFAANKLIHHCCFSHTKVQLKLISFPNWNRKEVCYPWSPSMITLNTSSGFLLILIFGLSYYSFLRLFIFTHPVGFNLCFWLVLTFIPRNVLPSKKIKFFFLVFVTITYPHNEHIILCIYQTTICNWMQFVNKRMCSQKLAKGQNTWWSIIFKRGLLLYGESVTKTCGPLQGQSGIKFRINGKWLCLF